MSQCSGSIEDIKRVSLILDDEERPEELGLTGLTASDKQSGETLGDSMFSVSFKVQNIAVWLQFC